MTIFSINNTGLTKINQVPFKNEKEIQELTEKNLEEIFGLTFVETEFALNDLRIDTLVFDKEANAFVIIEYKRSSNFSVIDQGYAYLSLLLNNKADFVLQYAETFGKRIKKQDIDWSQSRVIFVSPKFTKYQLKAMEFKDLPFELWEVSKYENDLILFNQLKTSKNAESITKITKSDAVVQKVSREIKVYAEDFHLEQGSDETRELYDELKNRVLAIAESIEIRPRKKYVGFISKTNFIDIRLQKLSIKAWLNLPFGKLDDPRKLARNVSNIGHWGNGDYELILKPSTDLDYVMTLIKQAYAYRS